MNSTIMTLQADMGQVVVNKRLKSLKLQGFEIHDLNFHITPDIKTTPLRLSMKVLDIENLPALFKWIGIDKTYAAEINKLKLINEGLKSENVFSISTSAMKLEDLSFETDEDSDAPGSAYLLVSIAKGNLTTFVPDPKTGATKVHASFAWDSTQA